MSIYIVHDDPVIDQCGCCDNGIQGDHYCRFCGGDGISVFDLSALATLAHNLAVVAFGERMFRLGSKYSDDLWNVEMLGKRWRPGCGKAAP